MKSYDHFIVFGQIVTTFMIFLLLFWAPTHSYLFSIAFSFSFFNFRFQFCFSFRFKLPFFAFPFLLFGFRFSSSFIIFHFKFFIFRFSVLFSFSVFCFSIFDISFYFLFFVFCFQLFFSIVVLRQASSARRPSFYSQNEAKREQRPGNSLIRSFFRGKHRFVRFLARIGHDYRVIFWLF